MKQLLKEEVEKRSTELTALIAALIVVGAAASATDIIDSGSSPGLVAEYRFDTGAGDTAYDSAGNNDGEINGASWTDGIEGEALSFDGEDDYVELDGFKGVKGQSSRTTSFWFKSGTDKNHRLVRWGANNPGEKYVIRIYEGDHLRVENSGGQKYDTEYDVTDGEWHHLAVVFPENGNSVQDHRIYVDGRLADNTGGGDQSLDTAENVDVHLGDQAWAPEHMEGKMDNVKIYSEELNKSQVRSLYKSGSWRIGSTTEESDPDQVLDLTFQHQNSSHVFDTSGYNNHGKPQNGALQERAGGCKVGRCYSFSAGQSVDTSADVSDLGIDGNKPKTVMAWAKIDSFDTGGLWQVGTTSDSQEFSLRTKSSEDSFRAQLWGSGDFDFSCDSKGEWVHFALVHDGSKTEAYCDGSLVDSRTQNVDTVDSVPFTVGEWEGTSLKGKMDQVKVFNRSLTRQDIIEEAEGLSSSGATASYRFNQEGGDAVHDSSMNNFHAELEPDEQSGPDRVDSVRGGALEFDGNDDYVSGNQEVLEKISNSSFSIDTWVYRQSTNDDTFIGFISNNYNGFVLIRNDDNLPNTRLENIDGDRLDLNPPDISQEKWTNVIVTYDHEAGEAKVYYDGELQDSGSFGSGQSHDVDISGEDPSIGRDGRGNSYFQGRLDNVRIHDYALSEEEVEERYASQKSSVGSSGGDRDEDSLQDGLVLSQTFNRIETCGQGDTVSCPSGVSGEVAVDESGEANHGELVKSPKEKLSGECKVGGCLGLDDGDNTRVDISDPNELVSPSITHSAWVKIDDTGARQITGQDQNHIHSELQARSDGSVHFWMEDSSDADYNVFTGNLNDGSWHHVVGTYDNETGDMKIYVDGEQVDSATYGDFVPVDQADNFRIGHGDTGYFDGSIDQVRIYDRPLSNQEIWKLYTNGRDRESGMAGPVANYRMQTESSPLPDVSGEGNHGDLNLLGEAGTFNTSDGEWKKIKFDRSYAEPVVIGTTNTQNGDPALSFEARSVDSGSAEMRVCESEAEEAEGCDTHGTERAGYMVINAKATEDIPGIEAGSFEINSHHDTNSRTVSYSESFSNTPVVMANVNSDKGNNPVEARVTSYSASDFVAGICYQDSDNGCDSSHPTEEVAWVAVEPSNIPFEQHFEVGSTGANVGGSNWYSQSFSTSFSEKPVVTATTLSENGGQELLIDEVRNVDASGVEVRYCEAENGDSCNGHNQEDVGWFATETGLLSYSNGNFPRYVDTERGKALEFDGEDDEILVDSFDADIHEGISMSFWIYPEGDSSYSYPDIIKTDNYAFEGYNEGSGGIDFNFQVGSGIQTNNNYDFDKWHHVTGVHTGDQISIYVDGEKVTTATDSETFSDISSQLGMGSKRNREYFDGKLDDVRIYPYALDSEQVKQVMNSGSVSAG